MALLDSVLNIICLIWILSCSLILTPSVAQPSPQPCHTLTLSSSLTLQQAVEQSMSNTSSSCVRIELPSGEHEISSQTLFSAREVKDVEFIGLGDSVFVSCSYALSENFTWYFDRLDSVKMFSLHFEGCPRPMRLNTIAEVEIQDCSFRFFTEAALDVFNCHHTLFNRTTLEHNSGSGIVQVSYRGNTGGVAFGYNTLPENFNSPSLIVSNSTFRDNRALASSAFLTSSQAFFGQIFTGRGGAVGVFSNESRHDLNVSITDCVFEGNYARSFGGGLYLLLGGFTTHHKILMERTRVISNEGQLGGGGIQSSFFNNGPEDDPLLMTFVDCEISNNTAIAGGGMFVFTSTTGGEGNLDQVRNTVFSGNRGFVGGQEDYGAALALSLLNPLVERSNFPRHEITNCTFIGNSGANGVVSIGYSPMNFTGTNLFIQNTGTSLRVVGALVYLSGELNFVNNSGGEDSALHLLSFAQVVLSRGLQINFEGNSGRFGASILIDTITTSTVYDQLASNPQCPFLYEDPAIVPEDWTEVTIRFDANTATLGSAIYMSRLDACSWFSRTPPFFNSTFLIDWPIWQIEDTNSNTGYTASEQMNATLSIQTQAAKLVISNTTVKAWPGFRLFIDVGGWDQFSHFTTATAGFFFTPFNDSLGIPQVQFIPEVVVVGTDPATGLLTRGFTVYYGIGDITTGSGGSVGARNYEGPLGVVSVEDPIDTLPVEPASFTLEAFICPGGYVLQPHTSLTGISVCTCNEEISDVFLCKDDQETVVIRRGKWAVFVPDTPQSNMEFYACPAGYCRCSYDRSVDNTTCIYSYSHSDPDLQCVCGRKGVLCGECRDESEGVSALLNECVTCSDTSGLLILALIVLDAVVFLVITLLDKPLPSWTYPFIFYIQLSPVLGLYFPDTFIKVGKYLYFVGSASGFYFLYDFCLYGKMNSEMAYFLRFLPLFVAILTCTPIIIIRSCVYRKMLNKRPLQHHGVWWVVLLMYSHVVYTSMTLLNCPSITDTSGETAPRWFVNGEVECFTGSHIALALLAILVLLTALLLLPLSVLVTTMPWRRYGLKYLRPPLVVVYRDGCHWWASVELSRRFFLILFTVALPRNEVVHVLILAIYITVYGFAQPYKSRLANILETAVNLNFLFLLIINATSFFNSDLFTFSSISESTSDSSSVCPASIGGVALVSWILMPVYYLPLIGLCITAAVLATLFLRARWQRRRAAADLTDSLGFDSTEDYGYTAMPENAQTWTIQLVKGDSEEDGFVILKQHGKTSIRGRPTNSHYSMSNLFRKSTKNSQ